MPMEHENCPCMETCPLNRAMALIGGKWKMQILCSLYNNGPTRYNQLKKALDGVSNTVLANALRELEGTDWFTGVSTWRSLSGWSTPSPSRAASSSPFWTRWAIGAWPSRRKKAAGGACGQTDRVSG